MLCLKLNCYSNQKIQIYILFTLLVKDWTKAFWMDNLRDQNWFRGHLVSWSEKKWILYLRMWQVLKNQKLESDQKPSVTLKHWIDYGRYLITANIYVEL
jgi:hypothetical protein